ncbi:hypothetical protein LOY97_006405, partial [Ophidiomyces ophidiicola]
MLLLPVLLLLNVRSALSLCSHGTVLHPRREGGIGELPNFDYTAARGPTNWQSISRENILCATGLRQSPINLDQSIPIEPAGFIRSTIPRQDILFQNLGTTAEVVLEGTTLVGGVGEFKLEQFHFHTPSEHRIGGQFFPMELHLVHSQIGNRGQIAVIVILFQVSGRGGFGDLERIISQSNRIRDRGQQISMRQMDFGLLSRSISTLPSFRYVGSLTTPPCTEGVIFLVIAQPLSIGVDFFNTLKGVTGFNSRFLQGGIPSRQNVLLSGLHNVGLTNQQCSRLTEGLELIGE